MLMNHEAGRKTLLELADILDGLEVPFFLVQGTALGAYRDGGFVPSEKDIDIGVLYEHLSVRIASIAGLLVSRGYEIESWSKPFSLCRTLVVKMHGIKADIVGVMRWLDKRFVASPVNPHVAEPYAIVHDAKLLETYQQVELFGRTFNVPSPIETYLQREYGDWKTPRDDHVSRTRVYNLLRDNGITDGSILT